MRTVKKLAAFLTATVMAVSLSACAGTKAEQQKTIHVKCPACGYEFNAPIHH